MSFCDISDLIMTSHLGPGYKVCCHQHLDVIKRMKKRLFETNRSDICVITVHPVFSKGGTKKHSSKRVKPRTIIIVVQKRGTQPRSPKNDFQRILINYEILLLPSRFSTVFACFGLIC